MKLFDVYPLLPVTPESAHGAIITDTEGNEYLDFYGGHAVISVGHSHPHYISKLTGQLNKISFYSNAVPIPLQDELASKLARISGYDQFSLFMCNSGAEANENALKLASFVNKRKKIIAFKGSFHGRTSAAVAATDDLKINAQINLQHEIVFLPLNNYEAAAEGIDDDTCAVIIEGIQGVAGIIEPEIGFLKLLRKKCSEKGALLILDEVQSGCGRTGNYFAHSKSGIIPDIITMAKGIGNGFPVGAVLIHPDIHAKHGMLGTTFGGNYLACAACIAVIDIIEQESLMDNARMIGTFLKKKISEIENVINVSGEGLMLGIKLNQPAGSVRNKLLVRHNIFTGSASDPNIIRILPPLNINLNQAQQFVEALQAVLNPVLIEA
ncbi:MAG: aminotransferase class III-fold pyridoxal phosphate-dependent enzyme [Bacteroidia bacterium]